MSYPPEADQYPGEWMPTPKLSDYEAEALLEYLEEECTSQNR
jgi:hypothetical protein